MGYSSRRGKRPPEYASKAAHGHIIRDPAVSEFLEQCHLPTLAADVSFEEHVVIPFQAPIQNNIHHVIAVDGSYREVAVRSEFPSATVCFFQFGALIFSIEDLEGLGQQPFIDPDDMAKLKQIQRIKLTLPIRNIILKGEPSLVLSVRKAIYNFFLAYNSDGALVETLLWFIFRDYGPQIQEWKLASCPLCGGSDIPLRRQDMTQRYTFLCNRCGKEIFLTDVFRLHEAVDNELGAGGILGYVVTALEQIILVHLIRIILQQRPSLLREVIFIKDGPLAFFGQTANMYKPMRDLVKFLFDHHDLHLAGLEKSGAFVEHADEIADNLRDGSVLLLDNNYIYKYIVPGKADPANPYGRTTYYGNKLIFKTSSGAMHVITIPTKEILPNPKPEDLANLQVILANVEKLKCDMYDNSLIPVALVNKLVSLADYPSSRILQKFAVSKVANN